MRNIKSHGRDLHDRINLYSRSQWQGYRADRTPRVLARLTEPHQSLARWRSRLVPAIDKRKAEHVRGARRGATRLLLEKPEAFRRRLEVMWETG